MLTKGKMMKALNERGIRTNEQGKKLSHCKTYEIIKLFYKEGLNNA